MRMLVYAEHNMQVYEHNITNIGLTKICTIRLSTNITIITLTENICTMKLNTRISTMRMRTTILTECSTVVKYVKRRALAL